MILDDCSSILVYGTLIFQEFCINGLKLRLKYRMDLMGLRSLDTLNLNDGLYLPGGYVLYPPQSSYKSLVHVFDIERANMHLIKATDSNISKT